MADVVDVYDLTPLQEGLLFHAVRTDAPDGGQTRQDPGSYVNHLEFDLIGPLDPEAFRAGWQQVVDRHDALRAAFHWAEASTPVQAVHTSCPLPIALHDLTAQDPAAREAALRKELSRLRAAPLDLTAPPLMALTLFRLSEDRHRVLWTHHHLVLDGWSLAVVFAEAMRVYQGLVTGEPSVLPAARPFGDHLRWLNRREKDADTAFWRGELDNLDGPTALPNPVRVTGPADGVFGRHTAEVSGKPLESVRALAAECQVTLATVLQAALALTLDRYTGSRGDVVFGTTVAGRPAELPGVESMVGLFINTVPVRVGIDRGQSVRAFLADRMRRGGALQDHQYTPLAEVQQLAGARAGTDGGLFDTLLVVENFPLGEGARTEWAGLRVVTGAAEEHTHYPLTITLLPGRVLRLEADWRRDRVDDSLAEGLLGHLVHVLVSLAADPDRRLDGLPALPAATARRLRRWSGSDQPPEHHRAVQPWTSLSELVSARAASCPDAAAVREPGRDGTLGLVLDYAGLDRAASRLAADLRGRGIGPGDLVGVELERGAALPVALLGVLRSGAAYVPLDPELPAARRRALAEAASVAAVLGPRDVELPRLCAPGDTDNGSAEVAPVTPDQPAYAVFTSGSTGKPKGVLVPHSALLRHSRVIVTRYRLGPADRVLLFSQPSFDVTAEEIFPTWAAGGAVVVHPPGRADTLKGFRDLLDRERVTVANLPAAYWHAWQAELDGATVPEQLRLLVVGNEKVWTSRVADWRTAAGSRVRLLNAYGITETTITSTLYEPPAALPVTDALPVGRPLPGTTVHVLDRRGDAVPPGVPGEVFIGGPGVALGYLGDPARTAARFVPDPFAARAGARLYRTGDVGRWLPDGVLLLDGRADEQVQIRGHRVEPGEVEAALCGHPRVAAAAVVAVPGPDDAPQLVAHVVPKGPDGSAPSTEALTAHLAGRLPAAMIPVAWSVLPALPLLPSGKVDRKSLPAVRLDPVRRTPPLGPVEGWLAQVWNAVLHHASTPSREDDFFRLGGHSLAAVQVTSRVRRSLRAQVPVRLLFDHPTLADYARTVRAARREESGTTAREQARVVPAPAARRGELSPAEERLWFLHRLDPRAAGYHLPVAYRLTGPLDTAALSRAVAAVAVRHPALRTRYTESDGRPVAVVDETCAAAPVVEQVAGGPGALAELLAAEARRPFDLEADQPVRFRLLATGPREHVLACTAHHIAVDGWSLSLLMAELAAEYSQYGEHSQYGRQTDGTAADSTAADGTAMPAALDYRDFAAAQRELLAGPDGERLLGYWRGALEGAPQLLALPADRPRPPQRGDGAARLEFTVPAELAGQIKAIAARGGGTPFIVLLAAYQLLLNRYTGQDDLLVGVPVAGRLHQEAEPLIGNFVNTLVLRARFRPGESFTALLDQVRDRVLDAVDHQELPFERIVDALATRRDLSHPPLVQALFAFQNTPHRRFALPGVECAPLPADPAAQLDLSLAMAEEDGTLAGVWEYSTELFDPGTIDALARSFLRLLADVCADPDAPADRARLLGPAEEAGLLALSTGPEPLAAPTTLTRLLRSRVAATPDAPAVIAEAADGTVEQISWSGLDAWAERIAARLRAHGVGRGDLVGVHTRRAASMPAALWGVLKTGAAYVPLDPGHPDQRLDRMASTAGLSVIVTQRDLPSPGLRGPVHWISADEPALRAPDGEEATPPPYEPSGDIGPQDAAYVLFTSGSTGAPKGVVVTHGNVTTHLNWFSSVFRPALGDRLLQHTAYSFDVSVPELFGGLPGGAAMVLGDPARQADARYIIELMQRHAVTYAGGVPSFLRMLAEDGGLAGCGALRSLMSCGEALPMDLVAALTAQTGAALHNQYGPTETTVTATQWLPPRRAADHATPCPAATDPAAHGEQAVAPLGTPAPATGAHVLDRYLRPVPPGVPGELYLSGPLVARGYLADPSRTAQWFLPDPYGAEPGGRMYRTGDLALRRRDGTLEFLGRTDRQTKLRGFRVELGEIEATLAAHPQVAVAAVALAGHGDRARIVGYAGRVAHAPGGAPSEEQLLAFCVARLPGYMVPAAVTVLDALPLNANGKVDHRALAERYPAQDPSPHGEPFAPPEGAGEEAIAAIWAELLGRPRIGRDENFFALGGNSLLAARTAARLRQDLGADLPVRAVFTAPTVRTLAAAADEALLAATDGAELDRLLSTLQARTQPIPTQKGPGHDGS